MSNPFETIDARLSNIENILLNLQVPPYHYGKDNEQEILTIKEAGSLLKLTVPTLYGYVSRNEIPFAKKGKRLYFSKDELTEWIRSGRNKSADELKDSAHTSVKKKGAKA